MCKQFNEKMDRGLVEHLDEPAMNLCFMDICASLESNIHVCMANLGHRHKVRNDLLLSSNSDAEQSVRLYVRFPRNELRPSSSVKMAK